MELWPICTSIPHDAGQVRRTLEDVALTSVHLHVEEGLSVSVCEDL